VNGYGINIKSNSNVRKDAYLFGESQSRVVVSISPSDQESFETYLKSKEQNFEFLGKVEGSNISIDGENYGNIKVLKEKFDTALENQLH